MVKYDEQVVFKDAQSSAVEGRLRFVVKHKAQPDQLLKGNSPRKGETDRIDTPKAQPLEQAVRCARFKFDR